MNGAQPTTSRGRILHLLKMNGSLTARELSGFLGISVMAVHQHLRNLTDAGLVSYYDQRGKVGRPSRHWELTKAAASAFPDYHRELSVNLVRAVREVCGDEALRAVLEDVKKTMVEAARTRMPGEDTPLRERALALARIREEAGYMAEMKEDEDGKVRLVQYHCPVMDAAACCSELCEVELEALQDLLGEDLSIEREEHINAGDRCCTYVIAPRE